MVAFTPAMAFTSSAHAAAWKVSPTKATVYVGKYKTLKSTKTAKWTSSKKSVAKLTASKGKTVKVKGVKAGKATIKVTYKGKTKKIAITVKKATAITAVSVTGTVAVGQVLTAATTPEKATAKYQWYADGAAISGATAKTFTLTKDQLGKKITVKVTGTGAYTKTVTSNASTAVVKGVITAKYADANNYAELSIGDTAKITIAPTAAASMVDVQWYRGTVAIPGATGTSYTVTANDNGAQLYAVVTPKADMGYETAAITLVKTGTVGVNISTLGITLAAKDSTAVPTAGTAYGITATRTDATKAVVGGTWTAAAYLDSYAAGGTNTTAGGTFTPSDVSTLMNMAANTKTANFTYSPATSDAGHKIVVVLTNDKYSGSIQYTINSAAKKITSVTAAGDTTDQAYPGITTLTATTDPAGADVTYQWYQETTQSDGSKAYTAISGATSKTYQIPASYKGTTGTLNYKVYVKGTGAYATTEVKSAAVSLTLNPATTVAISEIDVNDADGATATVAQVGKTYTATTKPAAAASAVDYTWYAEAVSGTQNTANDTKLGTGSTYTVSKGLEGKKIYVSAAVNSSSTTYTLASANSLSDEIDVTADLGTLSLTYASAADITASTTTKYTTPTVGNYVVATGMPVSTTVNYTYYVDSKTSDNQLFTTAAHTTAVTNTTGALDTSATFYDGTGAKVSLAGKKLVVVATGTGATYGSATATATTAAFTAAAAHAIAAVTVAGPTNVTPAYAGQALTANAQYDSNADGTADHDFVSGAVAYSWKVAGTEVATTAAYTVKPSDIGKAITVTATPKDTSLASGSASWDNYGLTVVAAAFNVTAKNGTTTLAANAHVVGGNVLTLSVPDGYTDVTYTWTGASGATGNSWTIPTTLTSSFEVVVKGTYGGVTSTKTLTFTYHDDTTDYWVYTIA